MSSRRQYRAYRQSPGSLARAGGAVKRLDSVLSRRQAVESGEAVAPEGKALCETCYRFVRVRLDGALFSHNHCPGAPPNMGGRFTDYHLRPTTPETRRTTP